MRVMFGEVDGPRDKSLSRLQRRRGDIAPLMAVIIRVEIFSLKMF